MTFKCVILTTMTTMIMLLKKKIAGIKEKKQNDWKTHSIRKKIAMRERGTRAEEPIDGRTALPRARFLLVYFHSGDSLLLSFPPPLPPQPQAQQERARSSSTISNDNKHSKNKNNDERSLAK